MGNLFCTVPLGKLQERKNGWDWIGIKRENQDFKKMWAHHPPPQGRGLSVFMLFVR